MALRALVSSPAFQGGGGEGASRLVIARPEAEANTPEAWALGKRIVSLVGSVVEVEQAAVGATQLPPKRQAEVPALTPHKALKVSTSSTTQWVVEAQAAIQHGAASARADLKEPVAQGEVAEAALTQAGEEAPMPCEAEAHESDGAEAPSVVEATKAEAEAAKTSEAEAMEVRAFGTTEVGVAEAGAPRTTEAEVVERALAVVSSHYTSVDLEAVSDGYVLAENDEEADEEVAKLMKVAKGLGTALVKLFEEEVVPPTPSIDAGDPEP
ncbi:uncharacterized protein [Miscanthus floridulus]|uniref:uncharacterized protein n=1 Tax=Miscanthus floridulus TaxID=154761 RepID=UPI00345A9C09